MNDNDPVLVVGGGLAGVGCAHRLGDEGHEVVLLDQNDYHQFQPLLYQVATAQLPAEDIARPHRRIFREYPAVETVNSRVTKVSLIDRIVQLEDGRSLAGSHIVMAVGARPNFFGTTGAAEHAFPLYSVPDAERLRLHLRDLLAQVAAGASPEEAPLDVVVVGGGPTGVEIAGAVTELMAALHKHGQIAAPGRVVLVDRADTVLGAFSEKSRRYATKKLKRAGVELRLGVGVSAVHPDRVELTDGSEIRTRTVVWGGGESAAELAADCGPEPGRGGRLDVLPDLSVPGFPGAYAVGDVANIPDAKGVPLPQLGSVAQQSGFWVADNIVREKAGRPTEPFRYKDKGIMAMIGRNAAVAEVGKRRHQVDGPVAFAAWLGVHAWLLSGMRQRVDAFVSWAWDFLGSSRSSSLIEDPDAARIAWDDAELPELVSAGAPAAADPSSTVIGARP